MVKSQVTHEKVFKPFVKYFEKQWIMKQRADKIADASEELEKGKIAAAIFLNRMSYPGTKICQGLEDFTCVDDDQPGNCELSDDDDADDTHLSHPNIDCQLAHGISRDG
ncbi:hypothetical protein ACLKA6_010230 [Drosophila palustris]